MKKSVTFRFYEDTVSCLDKLAEASGKSATLYLEDLIREKYRRALLPMQELYRTFEGRLDVGCRSGYIVTALMNGYLELEYVTVYSDSEDKKYIFKETKTYNRNTEWNNSLVYDLMADIADGNVEVLR